MKITRLILVLAVAGFYGCSDREEATSGEEKTSLIEKAGQLGDETVAQVKKGASEVGETASESLDSVTDKVDETVDSLKRVGSQAVESVADTVSKKSESKSRETAEVDDIIDPEQIAMGKTIYQKNCMACHAAGVAGAPKLSDAAVWEPRIAQGMETLNDHAINGFKGSMGYMPPKGGFAALDDDKVKAAVAYMVSASQ